VYLRCTRLQDISGIQNIYFDWANNLWTCDLLSKKAKHTFKDLIARRGYSERVANELWKWYDFSEKKGVASF
jgi:hypothetical protein